MLGVLVLNHDGIIVAVSEDAGQHLRNAKTLIGKPFDPAQIGDLTSFSSPVALGSEKLQIIALFPQDPVRRRTILLIEDDQALREGTGAMLARQGYEVLAAADGEEAIALFQRSETRVDLVISDVVMPKVSGDEFYLVLQQLNPGTRFLFISGYSPREVMELTSLGPEVPLISKPWTSQELLQKIREVL